MNQEIGKKLLSILKVEQVKKDEPMKIHTTFRVGGPASYFVTPETEEEIAKVIEVCTQENVPYYIVGNGSNLLVSDQGYEGVIIQIYKQMNQVEITENEIHAQAGALLSMIANRAMEAELTGFEFAAGIPGTIGGAMVMNAGAHGREMKDIVDAVTYYNCENDEIETIKKEECNFEYRNSKFKNSNVIIIKAILKLQKANSIEIKQKMDEYKQFRIEKQPIEYPSAGSTFKRGADFITAKLIDEAGLKGYTVGGAQVSEKHAGFIINKNNATATDIINLIEEVQKIVYEKFNKKIELEIEII